MALLTTFGISETKIHIYIRFRQAEAMKTYKKNHGLSLIEIMVAVAIIAILASITIGIVSHIDKQSNERSY